MAGLPTARLVVYEGEAHLATLCNHFEEIAQVLLGQSPDGSKIGPPTA